MKFAALTVLLTALAVPVASAYMPPPPPTLDEIDKVAAGLPGSQWMLEVKNEDGAFTGELAFISGNRFTLKVSEVGGKPDDIETGTGIWGVVEANADGVFVLALDILERKKDGDYDSDEVIVFRLKAADYRVLSGTVVDDDDPAAVTLTRR